jgi:glutaredoxin
MENVDVNAAKNLLAQNGIDLSKIDSEKMEKLMSICDKVSDPSQISPEVISEVTNILGV